MRGLNNSNGKYIILPQYGILGAILADSQRGDNHKNLPPSPASLRISAGNTELGSPSSLGQLAPERLWAKPSAFPPYLA
jgi:hypothetical protein